ncbi:MAG: hypothetical protein P4M08_04370 [Oligoflexia bacterium]|nr:hypothetical protein [Oligoflexia bacterium]
MNSGRFLGTSALIALLLAAAPGAYAVETSCVLSELGDLSGATRVVIDPFPGWAKGASAERMKEIIDRINRTLIGDLEPARQIKITLVRPHDARADSISSFQIFLAWPPKDEQDLEATLSHEYGHALFKRNMERYAPAWKQWNALTEKERMTGPRPAAPPGLYRSTDYEELLADTLAVIEADDPKAMAKALKPMEGNFGRDFTVNLSVKEFAKRRASTATELLSTPEKTDPHHTLNPVRSFIWNQYLSKPENKPYYGKILSTLYRVSAEDMLKQAKESELPVRRGNWLKKFNKRLIKKLKKALKDFE